MILLVEDNEHLAKEIIADLEWYGIQYDWATSFFEAKVLIRYNKYDAYLLDQVLPRRKGEQDLDHFGCTLARYAIRHGVNPRRICSISYDVDESAWPDNVKHVEKRFYTQALTYLHDNEFITMENE